MNARAKTPPAFKTRRDIERYLGGKTIECLLCGQRFRRLGGHLAAKHQVSVDEYRRRFGLPWSRGLTSAASVASSGWTDERKAKARKLARKSRFFESAHLTARRAPAPFVKTEAVKNLGRHAVGFGKAFERRVRALFDKGLTDAAIALALGVGRATVPTARCTGAGASDVSRLAADSGTRLKKQDAPLCRASGRSA